MAKFKLIKKFPSSPEVGTIFTGGEGFCYKERGMDGKKPFFFIINDLLGERCRKQP